LGKRKKKKKNLERFQTFDVKAVSEKHHLKHMDFSLFHQSFTFFCGTQFNTFHVTLTEGQFVEVMCETSALVLRIGCGKHFVHKVAAFHLKFGEAVQVDCL